MYLGRYALWGFRRVYPRNATNERASFANSIVFSIQRSSTSRPSCTRANQPSHEAGDTNSCAFSLHSSIFQLQVAVMPKKPINWGMLAKMFIGYVQP